MLQILAGLYPAFIFLHNLFRWLTVAAALYALARAVWGWLGKRNWEKGDHTAGIVFTSMMDLQLLLGLLLYFVNSPIVATAFSNFSAAMRSNDLRFFAIEHLALMLLAIVAAHLGRSFSLKASDAAAKHRTAALWFFASLVLTAAAIPWWRPLLRF